jgi:hypothetical protein
MSRFLLLAPGMRPGMKPPVNESFGRKNARAWNRASVVARVAPKVKKGGQESIPL